jgi:hypothetical protein
MRKKLVLRTVLIDLAIVLFSFLFLFVAKWLSRGQDTCLSHRVLHLYCPACGGTRALSALLRGQFLTCLSLFPPILIAVAIGIELHIRVVIAYRKKDWALITRYPANRWIVLGASVAIWFLLRNILLLVWEIDLSGDFILR